MITNREKVKEILGQKRWSKRCYPACFFINQVPYDSVLKVFYTPDLCFILRNNIYPKLAYNYVKLGKKGKNYVYLVAFKPWEEYQEIVNKYGGNNE